jgi:hypothetical protein
MTKVIIALPGRTFSGGFMINLLETVQTLKSKNYTVMITNEYSSSMSLGVPIKNHLVVK